MTGLEEEDDISTLVLSRVALSGCRFFSNELDLCEYLLIAIRDLEGTPELTQEDDELVAELEENTGNDFQSVLDIVYSKTKQIYHESRDDQTIEFIFNATFSLLTFCRTEKRYISNIEKLAQIFSSQNPKFEQVNIRLLALLFNSIPAKNETRPFVFQRLLNLVEGSNITLASQMRGQLKNLKSWMKHWDLSSQNKKDMYYTASKVASRADDKEQAQEFLISYLQQWQSSDTISDDVITEASQAVIAAITSTNINTRIVFELASSPVVQAMANNDKYTLLYQLLNIIYQGTVIDFQLFHQNHSEYISSLGLEFDHLIPKMRLLTLASIGNTQSMITFDSLQKQLNVKTLEEMEKYIILAVKNKLIYAKIDHQTQSLFIAKSTQRVFTKLLWHDISHKLSTWQQNTKTILQIIHSAGLRSWILRQQQSKS